MSQVVQLMSRPKSFFVLQQEYWEISPCPCAKDREQCDRGVERKTD